MNLLIDTSFENIKEHWKLINCTYLNGYLKSTDKVFGIEQDLVLPDICKLYFSFKYISFTKDIKDVIIGIQSNDTLESTFQCGTFKKKKQISVISDIKSEKIKVRLIFESNIKDNNVFIKNPLLVNLNYFNLSNKLKCLLDLTLKYNKGYTYKNLCTTNEIKSNSPLIKSLKINKKDVKIGSYIEYASNEPMHINCAFPNEKDHYYLVKLDYKEVNQFGNVKFTYGDYQTFSYNQEQIYSVFKSDGKTLLNLDVVCNEILPYKLNLKHILIIDITNMHILDKHVGYLPFIGDKR